MNVNAVFFYSKKVMLVLVISFALSSFGFQVTLSDPVVIPGLDGSIANLSISPGGDRILFRSEEPGQAGIKVFKPDGELELHLEVPGQRVSFGAFARYPAYGVYLATGYADGAINIWVFSDRTGAFLGYGYVNRDDSWQKHPAFYQQFIPVGNKLFVSDYTTQSQFTEPLLKEVRMVPHDDGYRFEQVGEAFSRNVQEAKYFEGNFSERWIVPTEHDDGTLCVVDQLQPRVWIFEREAGRGYKRAYHRPLQLEHRVFPLDEYHNQPPEGDHEALRKWYHQFSMVGGFYRFDKNHSLLGYSAPNLEHPWYSPTPDEKNSEMSPFILHLTFMDRKFKTKGFARFPGYFLLGVDSRGKILIWKGEKIVDEEGPFDPYQITIRTIGPDQFQRPSFFRSMRDWFSR